MKLYLPSLYCCHDTVLSYFGTVMALPLVDIVEIFFMYDFFVLYAIVCRL